VIENVCAYQKSSPQGKGGGSTKGEGKPHRAPRLSHIKKEKKKKRSALSREKKKKKKRMNQRKEKKAPVRHVTAAEKEGVFLERKKKEKEGGPKYKMRLFKKKEHHDFFSWKKGRREMIRELWRGKRDGRGHLCTRARGREDVSWEKKEGYKRKG